MEMSRLIFKSLNNMWMNVFTAFYNNGYKKSVFF